MGWLTLRRWIKRFQQISYPFFKGKICSFYLFEGMGSFSLIEAHDQVDQLEWRKRVEALPEVERKRAGAAFTFAGHALAAIQEAGGDASRVDWEVVEMVAAKESLIENRQEPDWVVAAILLYSPAQVSQVRHERVRQMVARLAEAGRDNDRQMDVGLDGP